MIEWTVLIEPAINAVKGLLGLAKKTLSTREYERLVNSAIQELLKLQPNLQEAEAAISTAERSGKSSGNLFVAKKMLDQVKVTTAKKPATTKKAAAPGVKKRSTHVTGKSLSSASSYKKSSGSSSSSKVRSSSAGKKR